MAFNFIEKLVEGDTLVIGTLVFAAAVGFAGGVWAFRQPNLSIEEQVRAEEAANRDRERYRRHREVNGPLT